MPLVLNKQSGETGMTGDWRGTLRFPGKLLHLTVELSHNWSGEITGKFFSPELNAQNVPLDEVKMTDSEIEFSSRLLDGGNFPVSSIKTKTCLMAIGVGSAPEFQIKLFLNRCRRSIR
ncbi:MAG: hypothetical protein R3C26_18330 [Calditrichia bacterium]